ncbi:transposase Tn3 family protein [Bacillus thuringiensis YBT-1518]|uniref:Transposase Tn3 family protein n=1 Tax=Bacillus thuringiensis YBT-1518 TaxID=529122 RepID=A0A9W3K979_BACTU|nr:transposase Tn3 family protein [Bacillus thuringiensis YBT-1518]
MKKNWTEDELLENFILVDIERKLIGNKTGASRLGFTVLLKYFQYEARFPVEKNDIPKTVVEYIAKQLNLSSDLFDQYRWGSEERNYTYHRKQIRDFFQFKEFTHTGGKRLEQWLEEHTAFTHDTDYLINQVYSLFRKWKVEPPSIRSMKRMIDSAIHTFEQKLYQGTYQQLSAQTCNHIDELLESHDYQEGYKENLNSVTFRQLLSSPHKPSVATMEIELKKLLTIRHLHIPDGLFHHLSPKLIKSTKYVQRLRR